MIGSRRRHSTWTPGDNAPAIPAYPLAGVVAMLRKAQIHTTAGDRWPWANDKDETLERVAGRLQFQNWLVRVGLAREWSEWTDRSGDDDA